MKIAISGSNGFIGQELCKYLEKQKYSIIRIPHNMIYRQPEELKEILSSVDIVINLAGSSIQKRWTRKYKIEIYRSRVHTTRIIVKTIASLQNRPKKLISVSAIGIYDSKNEHDEYSQNLSFDFLGKVAKDWEEASLYAKNLGLEVYVFRLGIVLGNTGGMIKKLYPLFYIGLGAVISSGKQFMSFIHISDLINMFHYAIESKLPDGTYNAVAPQYTTNKEFSRVFAQLLKRPLLLKIPKHALHLIYGKGATFLYTGQAVKPTALIEQNFPFQFSDIKSSLEDIIYKFQS